MNYYTFYTVLLFSEIDCSAVHCPALSFTSPQRGVLDHDKREEFSSDRVKNTASSQDLQNFFPAVNDLQNTGYCSWLNSSCRGYRRDTTTYYRTDLTVFFFFQLT